MLFKSKLDYKQQGGESTVIPADSGIEAERKRQGYVSWETILKKANEKAICTQPGSMEQLRKKEMPGKKHDQIEKLLKF